MASPTTVPDDASGTLEPSPPQPSIGLVASATTTSRTRDSNAPAPDAPESGSASPESFYRGLQWTADGTSIVTSTSDNRILAYVLPEDLLAKDEGHGDGHDDDSHASYLTPQGHVRFPEPFYTLSPSPYFSLADPLSQTVLVSCKDHPIQLHHLFPDAESGQHSHLCGYKLIRHQTEEYITAESLLWSWPGTHFLAGSANRLDYFDVTRTDSDGPVLTIPTIPSRRHAAKGSGIGMRGMVSALSSQSPAASATPLVAAGTWTRWLGLYDVARSNKAVANWSVRGVADGAFGVADDGSGVVQTIWSPCGRYLAVNERRATGILVYDIRGTGQPVSVLVGRDADTQQRLSCDVFSGGGTSSDGGFEVWAGSKDGRVVVWEGVGGQSGVLETSWSFDAHGSPVGATMLHSSGSVVATCSGAWTPPSDEDVDRALDFSAGGALSGMATTRITDDCSVKVWAVGLGAGEADQE